jgi:CRP-like cAMP-binding protein
MYFLVHGMVEVLGGVGKHMVRYTILEKGSFFGEVACLTAVKRTASIRAITQCNCFVLTSDSFDMMKVGTVCTTVPPGVCLYQ